MEAKRKNTIFCQIKVRSDLNKRGKKIFFFLCKTIDLFSFAIFDVVANAAENLEIHPKYQKAQMNRFRFRRKPHKGIGMYHYVYLIDIKHSSSNII